MEAANFLNDFYVNVGPTLAKSHDKEWKKDDCNITVDSSFSFTWISEAEVKRHVKEICISKSSAIDELSTRLLKDAFEIITFELTYVYNSCLQHGIFPETWGLSKVTPIPKTKLNSKKPEDWRPISQISLPGKILERIIHTQIYHYLEGNKILADNQHGFRRNSSTSTAIFDVLKELYGNWNDNKFSGCLFIDFSRAFDSIDHTILAEKLKLYGFDNTSLKLMVNYMSCRNQTTVVNGHVSTRAPVTYGTAQGSILGPLIFILYVNDLFDYIKHDSSIYMYADDTLLVCESDNIDSVTMKNKLSINFTKTKYMVIKHTKVPNEPTLIVEKNNINTVNQYEYLGVVLDDKLTMNKYLDAIWKKTNSKLGILAKIRRFISEKTAIRIYKCMIRPHLDYIDFTIDSGSADRIQKLDNLQKKAVRRIEYCLNPENRQNIETLMEKYNIESLRLRRKKNLAKIMYIQSSKIDNLKMSTTNIVLRSTRKVKMKKDFTSKTRVYNSPLYRGLRLWDSLPENIQKETDKASFKKRIATHPL